MLPQLLAPRGPLALLLRPLEDTRTVRIGGGRGGGGELKEQLALRLPVRRLSAPGVTF